MLNLKGAFVVIFNATVQAHILTESALGLYIDRASVVGFDKATRATFGNDALYALPCTLDCMTALAMNYAGIHADIVKGICACIASGLPIPNGSDASDSTEGGLGIKAAHTRPKAPKGSGGARVAVPATAQA